MNLTEGYLLKELEENNLDHVVTWHNKGFHNEGTRGKEGKCSRSVNCRSVEAEAKYTVLVNLKGYMVLRLALCEECYQNSPYIIKD